MASGWSQPAYRLLTWLLPPPCLHRLTRMRTYLGGPCGTPAMVVGSPPSLPWLSQHPHCGVTPSESWGPAHPLPSQGWDPLLPLRPPVSPSEPLTAAPSCLLPEAPGPVKAALSGRRGGGSPVSPPCPPGAHGAWHSGARAGCPQHLFCGRGFTELPAVRPDFSGRRGLLASQRSLKTWVWGGR